MPVFLKQKVNQWLGIALIGLLCVWTLIYYFGHKVSAMGNDYMDKGAFLESEN